MIRIRSFQNSDLPALFQVWMAHWSAIGPPPSVNLPRIEQAIVSRTFFDPAGLLVAVSDDEVVGWCHFLFPAEYDGRRQDCLASGSVANALTSPTATISSFFLRPEIGADVEQALMTEALTRIRASGFSSIYAGLIRDDRLGYAGLEPIGFGVGIADHDFRVAQLLERSGFARLQSAARLTASTMSYRPPVNREALQFRRSAATRSQASIPSDTRIAAGLSHIDIERFQLVDRAQQSLAEIGFWFSDPEAEVLSPSKVILDLGEVHDRGELSPPESFLIASVLQSLADRSIYSVETVVDSEKKTLIEQLQKICFELSDSGAVWGLNL